MAYFQIYEWYISISNYIGNVGVCVGLNVSYGAPSLDILPFCWF